MNCTIFSRLGGLALVAGALALSGCPDTDTSSMIVRASNNLNQVQTPQAWDFFYPTSLGWRDLLEGTMSMQSSVPGVGLASTVSMLFSVVSYSSTRSIIQTTFTGFLPFAPSSSSISTTSWSVNGDGTVIWGDGTSPQDVGTYGNNLFSGSAVVVTPASGSTDARTMRMIGRESLTTPAGPINAYKFDMGHYPMDFMWWAKGATLVRATSISTTSISSQGTATFSMELRLKSYSL